MISVNSNHYTSLRHHYLLFWEGRWPTKQEKKNIIEDIVSQKKGREWLFIKRERKKGHFLGLGL